MAGATEVIRVESKLSGLDTKVGDLDQSVQELTKRVDNLPQALSKAVLSKAVKSAAAGDLETSARALELSTAILKAATLQRLNAPAEFFAETIRQLDNIETTPVAAKVGPSLYQTRAVLAEYRSSLQSPPAHLPGNIQQGKRGVPLIKVGRPSFPYRFAFKDPIEDSTFTGGTQALDYVRWKNCVFINCDIEFSGGPVELDHVLFVNCIFHIASNSTASQLATYVALNETSAHIG